jgi:hypothetical protein
MVMMEDGHIYERVESLYVSDKYKIFLLTGQPLTEGGRMAFITARPFNSLDAAGIEALRAQAMPLDDKSAITIKSDAVALSFYDQCTGTSSTFPISQLDDDVRASLSRTANSAWDRFLPKSDPTVTKHDITVKKPLQLKHTP